MEYKVPPQPFDPDSFKATPWEARAKAAHRAQERLRDPALLQKDADERWEGLDPEQKAEFFSMALAVQASLEASGFTQQQAPSRTTTALLSFWGGYTGHLLAMLLPAGPLAGCVLSGLGSAAGVYAEPLLEKFGKALCGAEDRLRAWARSWRA